MKNKRHYEITFTNGMGYNDYVAKTMNEVIESLVKSTWFQEFEVKEIVLVEERN